MQTSEICIVNHYYMRITVATLTLLLVGSCADNHQFDRCPGGLLCPDGTRCSCRTDVAVGDSHTCAVLPTGAVRCWGRGKYGRLGYGNIFNIGDDELANTAGSLDLGAPVAQLSAGNGHTCALLDNGEVYCWGKGSDGRLGYGSDDHVGDDETAESVGPVDVGGSTIQIAAGARHTCALLATGYVRCWGLGENGQLGYGNTDSIGNDELPVTAGYVEFGVSIAELALGYFHSCALLTNGRVRCWGHGLYGQLGFGNTDDVGDDELPSSVAAVDVGGTVTQLAPGAWHTCVLLDTGSVRCWGWNERGQLGYGHTNNVGDDELPSSAGDVDVGGTVIQLTSGHYHTCALLDTGSVRCWGWNEYGQLGYGHKDNVGDDELPSSAGDVDVGGPVVWLTAGASRTCVVRDTGSLCCWGSGTDGAHGHGNTDNIGDDETPATACDIPYL